MAREEVRDVGRELVDMETRVKYSRPLSTILEKLIPPLPKPCPQAPSLAPQSFDRESQTTHTLHDLKPKPGPKSKPSREPNTRRSLSIRRPYSYLGEYPRPVGEGEVVYWAGKGMRGLAGGRERERENSRRKGTQNW